MANELFVFRHQHKSYFLFLWVAGEMYRLKKEERIKRVKGRVEVGVSYL